MPPQSQLSPIFDALANLPMFITTGKNKIMNLENGCVLQYYPFRPRFLLAPEERERLTIKYGVNILPDPQNNQIEIDLSDDQALRYSNYMHGLYNVLLRCSIGTTLSHKENASPSCDQSEVISNQNLRIKQLENEIERLTDANNELRIPVPNACDSSDILLQLRDLNVIPLCVKEYDYEALSRVLGNSDSSSFKSAVSSTIWNLQNAPVETEVKEALMKAIDIECKTW